MRILYLTSELAPFSKTGGLADVASALPAALALDGHEVVVMTPLYGSVPRSGLQPTGIGFTLQFPFGAVTARLHRRPLSAHHHGLFIEQPGLFDRSGLYQDGQVDYTDNAHRFAFFGAAALTACQQLDFIPDIVHLNDWQCGLAALALARGYRSTALARTRSVFTIHNLAYQGVFPKAVMGELGLPWNAFTPDGLEFYDQVSFLKAGLTYSDALTTVSPTYAREILTPEGGYGLDGVLRQRATVLHGVLNGIDATEWNPATDPHLAARFSSAAPAGKRPCKDALFEHFSLDRAVGGEPPPLFGIISRLAGQKGIDLLLAALPRLFEQGARAVVLGNGEVRLEEAFRALRDRFPRHLGLKLGFDSALAHQIEAGCDFFLMPSLYEPCGLNQLYSLRYGTVPVVRATGGLEDTVVDLSLERGTGIKFDAFSVADLNGAIDRALELYRAPAQLEAVRRRGMEADFSWTSSAKQYGKLYDELVSTPRNS